MFRYFDEICDSEDDSACIEILRISLFFANVKTVVDHRGWFTYQSIASFDFCTTKSRKLVKSCNRPAQQGTSCLFFIGSKDSISTIPSFNSSVRSMFHLILTTSSSSWSYFLIFPTIMKTFTLCFQGQRYTFEIMNVLRKICMAYKEV